MPFVKVCVSVFPLLLLFLSACLSPSETPVPLLPNVDKGIDKAPAFWASCKDKDKRYSWGLMRIQTRHGQCILNGVASPSQSSFNQSLGRVLMSDHLRLGTWYPLYPELYLALNHCKLKGFSIPYSVNGSIGHRYRILVVDSPWCSACPCPLLTYWGTAAESHRWW